MSYKSIYKEIWKKVKLSEVLDSYNISYKSYYGENGREYLFRCPFPDHDDLTPSFSFNENSGIWHCFVCGAGDFIKFLKIMEGHKKLNESIEYAKKLVGISTDVKIDFNLLDKSINEMVNIKPKIFFKSDKIELKEIKLPESYPAEDFFDIVKKRVNLETIKKWKMRYCHNPSSRFEEKYHGRLIIPVYFNEKLVTFAARDMIGRSEKWNEIKEEIRKGKYTEEEEKELIEKYSCKKILYPFGSPIASILFNWDEAKKNTDYVILVEGIFDAIRLINYGYNTIALFSTNLNDYRANILVKTFKTIYIALDNDNKVYFDGRKRNPGQEAAQKIMKDRLEDAEVYNIILPLGKDPDDCSDEEFKLAFKKSTELINNLIPFT